MQKTLWILPMFKNNQDRVTSLFYTHINYSFVYLNYNFFHYFSVRMILLSTSKLYLHVWSHLYGSHSFKDKNISYNDSFFLSTIFVQEPSNQNISNKDSLFDRNLLAKYSLK